MQGEDAGRQHGDDSQGYNQREKNSYRDGNGNIPKELPGLLLDEQNGDENSYRGKSRGQNGPPNLSGAVQRSLKPLFAHLPMAEDVFQDDHSVVNHHACGKRQSCQRDDVESPSQGAQKNKGGNHGHRNGNCHD